MTKPEIKRYIVTRELKYEVWAYSEADAQTKASLTLSLGFPMAIEVKEQGNVVRREIASV